MAKTGPKTEEGKAKAKENLIYWQKGVSGNPEGRPRKMLRRLEDKIGIEFNAALSKEDKYAIVESMMELSIEQLKAIAMDKEAPAFMLVVASAIKTDISKGRLGSIEQLFDRFFGKPEQVSRMHLSDNDGAPLITTVNIIER